MQHIAKSALATILTTMIIVAPPTLASPESTKTRIFQAQSLNAIVLTADVGDVRVEPGTTDTIEARVTLRPRRNSSFNTLPDVNKINMSAIVSGDRLTLDIKENNVEEAWVLRLPRKMLSALELRVGVGDVSVTNHAKQLKLDLGVGDATVVAPSGALIVNVGTGHARITTPLSNAGAVKGTTGVGNVALEGLASSLKSHMVGGEVNGKGRGQQLIKVTVGVGDLAIKLTP